MTSENRISFYCEIKVIIVIIIIIIIIMMMMIIIIIIVWPNWPINCVCMLCPSRNDQLVFSYNTSTAYKPPI